jgi:hypothetical protein
MFTTICSRISRYGINFQLNCLKTRQDQEYKNDYIEKGKETRHFQLVSCQPRGSQEHQNAQD